MNSSPMMKACARPSGDGCTAYSMSHAELDAVAEQRAGTASLYSGVVMIRTSRMPAIISVDSG